MTAASTETDYHNKLRGCDGMMSLDEREGG